MAPARRAAATTEAGSSARESTSSRGTSAASRSDPSSSAVSAADEPETARATSRPSPERRTRTTTTSARVAAAAPRASESSASPRLDDSATSRPVVEALAGFRVERVGSASALAAEELAVRAIRRPAVARHVLRRVRERERELVEVAHGRHAVNLATAMQPAVSEHVARGKATSPMVIDGGELGSPESQRGTRVCLWEGAHGGNPHFPRAD